jgi:hypothetical protein
MHLTRRLIPLLAGLLALAVTPACTAEEEFLQPDQAFRISGAATGPEAGTLAALERLQREVEVGEALRRRSATHLSVVYTAPDLSLMLNGQPLPQGRDVPVLSRTQIDLPGLGVLTVTPGEGLEAADQLAKAGLALATALARAGCASLDLARAAAAARIDAEARLAEGEGRLRLLAPAGAGTALADITVTRPSIEDVISRFYERHAAGP